jgi:acetylornithine deacetylase
MSSANLPPVRDLLTAVVGVPSVSSVNPQWDLSNVPLIHLLAAWLEDAGFAVEVMHLGGTPAKANLVATLGRGEGGLVLAGHADTVPFDAGRWRSDPFRLEERDGRLYGLGTSDMKSFFPLVLEAVRGLDAKDLRRPLVVVATADEETAMTGARALTARGAPLGRHAVVGEPTGMRPVRCHKGILTESIRLRGRSGHSSDPALGRSALEGMHRVMAALLAWREELQARHRSNAFRVAVPTLNLGHIHGGDNPNRICPDCELQMDLRFLPGMSRRELRAELEARVRNAVAGAELEVEIVHLSEGIPPLETPAGAGIVRLAEGLTGAEAEAVAFGTEAPYYHRLGSDVVVLGPGDIDQAHQPDEYLALDRIPAMVDLLRGLVRRLCVEGQEPG